MGTVNHAGALSLDWRNLEQLRLQAKRDPEVALKEAARQFEVLFMNMLLKSMRDATPQDGMFDSEQSRFYTSLLDQQLAQTLSTRGVGLAEVMVQQLRKGVPGATDPGAPGPAAAPPPPAPADARKPSAKGAAAPAPGANTRDFANRMWPHAVEASRATGIPARFIVGQAALESGWGQREIRGADGKPSFNLFGIKAGRSWHGATAEVMTTEYVNGIPRRVAQTFRAYSSYAEAFRDYGNLLKNTPRYACVLENCQDAAAFARGLQRAGYATDPLYADKLARVINSGVLRQSLA